MVYALIPAAGQGRRLPGAVKKQFSMLGRFPLIVHALRTFESASIVDEVCCIAPLEDLSYFEGLPVHYKLTKVRGILPGGKMRQDSVMAGMAFLEKKAQDHDIVVVHDGARPFITVGLIERVVEEAYRWGGAVAALPLTDSLKQVSEDGMIQKSVPREGLWVMQTPQAFRKGILAQAFHEAAQNCFYGTDEASLVARVGGSIRCVEGDPENIKITSALDFKMAERILRARAEGVS